MQWKYKKRSEVTEDKKNLKEITNKLKANKKEFDRAEVTLNNLKTELVNLSTNSPTEVSAVIETNLKNEKARLRDLQKTKDDLEKKFKKMNINVESIEKITEEINSINSEMQQIQENIDTFQAQQDELGIPSDFNEKKHKKSKAECDHNLIR